MKRHLLVLGLVTAVACGGGGPRPDPKPDPAPEGPTIPAEVIIEIYDALPTLEKVASTQGYEAALAKAARHSKYILSPVNDRLEVLARKVIVRPGEALSGKAKQERFDAYRSYVNLRRAFAKIVAADTTPRGLAILIRFLDEDVPEAKQVLEKASGKNFGFDRSRWSRWFTANQLRTGNADTRQAVQDWVAADGKTRVEILKTYMMISKELRVQSLAERYNAAASQSGGKVTTKDLEKLRLQALAVFIEALKSEQPQFANMALLGLVQLGSVAEDSVVDLVDSSAPLAGKLRAISVLGNRDSLSAAEKLLEFATNEEFRSSALQALGNLDLSAGDRKSVARDLHKVMSSVKSSEDTQRVLAAMILMGEMERFPLLLSQCPDDPKSRTFIDSRDVKNPAWLQMRRIARKTLDRQLELKHRNTPSWQKAGGGSFNPEAEFHKYARAHKLTLSRQNWRSWFKKVLQKMP